MLKTLFRQKTIEKIRAEAEKSAQNHPDGGLQKVLSARDLSFFGIAAIIGAGSFTALGSAIYNGGPGVTLMFVFCAIACGFTALCYSDFAGRIPVSGSAYTYAYASFGELMAWIIGWALIMEYAIGNVYVAFAWSSYCSTLMHDAGIALPAWLSCSYGDAMLQKTTLHAQAWAEAPVGLGFRFIVDLPALLINFLITALVYIGIRESRNFSNAMVVLKLSIIALVLAICYGMIIGKGLGHNWQPENPAGARGFFPNGFAGLMRAVNGVFFAYIGFDAVSVLAEESKNPQRDLPRGIIVSLIVCTAVYVLLAMALSGVAPYSDFNGVVDPLAFVFDERHLNMPWMRLLVSVCAIIAMTSVMLVMQAGQPRIWMSMGRDGLLPPAFSKIHPKYRTPHFSTLLTGLFVALLIIGSSTQFVLEFTSTGTLFAFVLVCGGVLFLPKQAKVKGQFHMPYWNGKYWFPLFSAGLILASALNGLHLKQSGECNIAMLFYWAVLIGLSLLSWRKQLSMIPLLGLSSCLFLLTGEDKNWHWFSIWFGIGLIVYFAYGYRKSKLVKEL